MRVQAIILVDGHYQQALLEDYFILHRLWRLLASHAPPKWSSAPGTSNHLDQPASDEILKQLTD